MTPIRILLLSEGKKKVFLKKKKKETKLNMAQLEQLLDTKGTVVRLP